MPTDLSMFFVWIAASGTVSGLISWLLANWQWFDDLGDTKPSLQQLIKLAISIALSVLSWALVTYIPAETVQQFQPLWAAIATGINVIMMQAVQGVHTRYTPWFIERQIRIADDKLLLLAKREILKNRIQVALVANRPPLPDAHG